MLEIRAHEDHVRCIDQFADRREILEWVVRQIFVERRIYRDGGRCEQQRIAIRRGAGDHAHARIAAPTAAIFDDHRLAERLRERD